MRIFKYLLSLICVVLGMAMLSGASGLNMPVKHYFVKQADCPTIDSSHMIITKPDCGEENGSIMGIKVISTGSKVFYTWVNSNKTVLSHTANLTNIPPGIYTLEVTDNSGCTNTVFSKPITVNSKNAVTIDDSKVAISNSSCKNDGAITGLRVANATTYEWQSLATGTIISTSTTTPDLVSIPAGSYQLTAGNNTCTQMSKVYTVNSAFSVPQVISAQITPAQCGTGAIAVNLGVDVGSPILNYVLRDESGNGVKNGVIFTDIPFRTLTINGLDGGTYYLYATDNSGACAVLLGTYKLGSGQLQIDKNATAVRNDRCNQHLGYIEPAFLPGVTPRKTWTYKWTDIATGKVVGYNKILTRAGAGVYQLYVTAGSADCAATDTFTVINVSPALIPPIAAGSTLCVPGIVNITVTNLDTAETFRLYNSLTDSIPIDSNKNGIFYERVSRTTSYYITRVHKDCESDRTEVIETVLFPVKIPNTFTPNNDGINDYWDISGMENFPGADIKIFTRNGQLIFHSINYPVPFDGTYRGSPVPTGVYYYIIDVKQPICFGKISGSLTIIR
ncbi:MAG: gliding motility-associated C-terminal domain-containing protein [Bacteroidetes bacterium]|nr:gliding motility-associated C-terminal domain-containing protein [Bacteroidota bacterium]